ncbi:MAG: 1-deoxy-D-xylulose-5-phosphate reductoisomerase [Acidobacteria bacterium]|nr:1-deoxy-D-xylulose-5-phosphate reductoisomerase [Acidobacteriota bacterium]
MTPRNIALLGSTGSIGVSTLDLIERFPGSFRVVTLAAGGNVDRLAEQVKRFRPALASVATAESAARLRAALGDPAQWGTAAASAWGRGATQVVHGEDGAVRCAAHADVEVVVAGIVGAAGLAPTFEAVRAGRVVALANKEALVVAGPVMISMAARSGATLLPVDSEHNALHQCLRAGAAPEVARLILTASGGPFLGKSARDLADVTPEQALKHPTWQMGRKISIDSATLMNKGLEVIEAHHLFGVPLDRIEVVVHPQSIVHSMVEYADGAIISQMSRTDMRHPIQYALTWPDRWVSPIQGLDLRTLGPLTFAMPDRGTFRCLDLGYRALESGGTMPAVLNAANEIAVQAFLDTRLGFLDIPAIIEGAMDRHRVEEARDLATVVRADAWAREAASAAVLRGRGAGRSVHS